MDADQHSLLAAGKRLEDETDPDGSIALPSVRSFFFFYTHMHLGALLSRTRRMLTGTILCRVTRSRRKGVLDVLGALDSHSTADRGAVYELYLEAEEDPGGA